MNSYYETLLLPTNATKQEIKANYVMLCRRYHPDKNRNTAEKFTEIQTAYDVLNDKYKKNFYDTFGSRWLSLLNDSRSTYMITHVFDRINIIFTVMAYTLICVNILVFPFLTYLYKNQMIITKLVSTMILIFLSIFLINIVLMRSVRHLYKEKESFNFHDETANLLLMVGIFYLLILQITFFISLFEKPDATHKMLYLLPYYAFELILLIHVYILIDEKEKKPKFRNALIKCIIRTITIHFTLLNINTIYKLYMFILWLGISLAMEMVEYRILVPFILFALCLITGNFNNLVTKCSSWYYCFLIVPYVAIIGMFLFQNFLMYKLKPYSVFQVGKMPLDV